MATQLMTPFRSIGNPASPQNYGEAGNLESLRGFISVKYAQVLCVTLSWCSMSITVRQWALLAVIIALVMLFSGGVFPANALTAPAKASSPGAAFNTSVLSAGSLPPFPSNLTHFIYIVRENHAFDDYLGDCALNINETCDYGKGWTSPTSGSSATETSPSGDQTYVPALHTLARDYAVFDNMYSGTDPYSSQAHAFLFADNVWGGTDSCATGGAEGTGSTTSWGTYNSTNVKGGSCSWSPNSGSQVYSSTDGSIFDRFTGTSVTPSKTTIPFLVDGDIIWELSSPGCTVSSTTGIPGSLNGNSEAVEHIGGCSNGWWYNSTSGAADMPPVVNGATGAPQILWGCQYYCSTGPSTFLDQYPAYAFISYVKDYGLPTYTFIELFDDHPGSNCGSSQAQTTCIKENDASMNLIVEDIENNTSTYRNNTVIAISEDDTQDGANGVDHINSGRRFPFVLVAPHNVEKFSTATGATCGIASGTQCGYVVHETYNTSNVLAVMERVEMNVNPSIFTTSAPSGNKNVFPMVENDYLAEGNPLSAVWRCGAPGVVCNTGASNQTLTSTTVSPNPVNALASSAVGLTATALDQSSSPISGATYAWAVRPASIGTLTAATGSSVTFDAGAAAGTGTIWENATYSGVTVGTTDAVTVTASVTLASVAISPSGGVLTAPSSYVHLQASSLANNGQSLTSLTTWAWKVTPASLGSLNSTNTRMVNLTVGATTGNITVWLNGTYSSLTKGTTEIVTISLATPILSYVTLTPQTLVLGTGATENFTAQAQDQYHHAYNTGVTYQWTLTNSALGTLSWVTGSKNYTILTAASTGGIYGSLNLNAYSGAPLASNSSSISLFGVTTTQSSPITGKGPLNVTYTAFGIGGVKPYGYTWNFGDGNTSVVANNTHEYCKVGSFTPKVTASDSKGHTATSTLLAVNITSTSCGVTSQLTASATGAPTTGSVPLTVYFTGSVSGGTPSYSYAWKFGDGGVSSSQSPSHMYSSVGNYVAKFWVNDSASGTSFATVAVTVSPATSHPGVAMAASPKSGSPPLQVSFSAEASGGSGSYTGYAWTFGDGGTDTGTDVQHTYTTTGTFPVEVTVTDTNSATGSAFTNISVSSSSVTLASVSVSPLTPTVSAGTPQSFTATPVCSTTCPGTGISYTWALSSSMLGSLSGSGTSDTFTALSTAGTVGLYVNATLGGNTVTASTIITVTTTAPTLESVSLSPAATQVASGAPQTFTATPVCSVTTCPTITYSWSLSNSAMGSITGSGNAVIFTAGSNAGTVGIFVNATLGSTTKGASSTILVTSSGQSNSSPWYLSSPGEYILIALIAAVVIALIAVVVLRSRKPKEPAPMQPYQETGPTQPYPGAEGQAPPPMEAYPPMEAPPGPPPPQ
jgi:PKD repeat protein